MCTRSKLPRVLRPIITILMVLFLLLSCTVIQERDFNDQYGKPMPQDRMVAPDTDEGMFYRQSVKPIIENRCVSCHACYDAPCQLKLDSAQGIDRGVNKKSVYSATRLVAVPPMRLFVDKQTTAQWRQEGFESVLNEREQSPATNTSASLLYQSLVLKQQHPLPDQPILSDTVFDFSLDRKNTCPSITEFKRYAQTNPQAGMPYGLPGLNKKEMAVLTRWLSEGAKMAASAPLTTDLSAELAQWEHFLNQDSLKSQLVARYIYEHLFLANLYFDTASNKTLSHGDVEFFKLVRSKTPPGKPIVIIPSRRPTDDPGVDRPYYRLQRDESVAVGKTHLPYVLNQARMDWIKTLFFKPQYEISVLPPYEQDYVNPFLTFKNIPARSRYRFMLEEAHFIISGFIKGPVCRGNVSVDVINDRFWVFFVNPDTEAIPMLDEFVAQQSRNLTLPGRNGSTAGLLGPWLEYSKANRNYLLAKRQALNKIFNGSMLLNEQLVWDGDGHNQNAALTIFRNYDNAAVVKGLIGADPKTAWIIDYPLLERIHYLLTVDFDVYGNIGHQLNTRLYMDFLRIEGEYNFLTLMPLDTRLTLRDHWYRGASNGVREYLYSCDSYLTEPPSIGYSSRNPKSELFLILKKRLEPALEDYFDIFSSHVPVAHQPLRALQNIRGSAATVMPEVTHLLVKDKQGQDYLYTILSNKAHSNITSLLLEEDNRLPKEDGLTIANGIIGDYPNAFLKVEEGDLLKMIEMIKKLRSEADYAALQTQFGVRRTDANFWQFSDRLHADYQRQRGQLAGRLDYNRLENR